MMVWASRGAWCELSILMIETGRKCDWTEYPCRTTLECSKNTEDVLEVFSLPSSINESQVTDLLVSIIESNPVRSLYWSYNPLSKLWLGEAEIALRVTP